MTPWTASPQAQAILARLAVTPPPLEEVRVDLWSRDYRTACFYRGPDADLLGALRDDWIDDAITTQWHAADDAGKVAIRAAVVAAPTVEQAIDAAFYAARDQQVAA